MVWAAIGRRRQFTATAWLDESNDIRPHDTKRIGKKYASVRYTTNALALGIALPILSSVRKRMIKENCVTFDKMHSSSICQLWIKEENKKLRKNMFGRRNRRVFVGSHNNLMVWALDKTCMSHLCTMHNYNFTSAPIFYTAICHISYFRRTCLDDKRSLERQQPTSPHSSQQRSIVCRVGNNVIISCCVNDHPLLQKKWYFGQNWRCFLCLKKMLCFGQQNMVDTTRSAADMLYTWLVSLSQINKIS